MWDLGNRDIIVLVSVISGWALLYNIFGPSIATVVTIFFVVVCATFAYIVADDETLPLFASQALLSALDYIERAFNDFKYLLASAYRQFVENITSLFRRVINPCRIYFNERLMAQRRRGTYQLSSEAHRPRASSKISSRYDLVDGLSPIPRNDRSRAGGNSSNVENTPYNDARSRIFERANSHDHVTSTPLLSWKNDDSRNGDVLFSSDRQTEDKNSWKNSQSFSQNRTLYRGEESSYSHEGSPWGTSIGPKMRPRAAGVKTVQTVAGPLLASTRYNIDPKVYSDVTSPGLTTRLTKYATEASTKLIHQSQYGTGQFPRVNLNSSPAPLINGRAGKARIPVTVRIAPPNTTEVVGSLRQKILTNVCRSESELQQQQQQQQQQQSVVQVLREISLKRHASREDVTPELAKKQRTDGAFGDGLENLEEMTQKRGRDELSRSEEEVSPRSKLSRPAKRTKMPSCHDILSSLSSSVGVSSGIKRKAIEVSRSGTPDIGKHFKSLDSGHGDVGNRRSSSRGATEPARSSERLFAEAESKDAPRANDKSLRNILDERAVRTFSSGKEILNAAEGRRDEKSTSKQDSRGSIENTTTKSSSAVKLTDKLFMKAEPENIDKIKTLIEEHGSTKPRFTTDDTDEIKKSDIVMMRQTSMKNRLKSMFDAISGKATSAINPRVVIQAEDKSSSSTEAIAVSLSSTTSTTNVNTSPIATSAIVPIIGKAKTSTTPAKHVTFQFSNKETAPAVDNADRTKVSTNETTIAGNIVIPVATKSDASFGENKSSSVSILTDSPISASRTSPLVGKSSASVARSTATTATPQFNARMFDSTANTSMFAAPSTSPSKSLAESSISTTQLVDENPSSAVNFSFGAVETEKTVETSVGQVAARVSSDFSAPTTVSGGVFNFGTAVKSNSGFPSASGIGQNFTNANTEGNANTLFGVSTTAASTVSQRVVVSTTTTTTTTTTNQPASNSSTTSTASFNVSTASSAPASIFGSANPSLVSAGFLSTAGASTAPSFTFGTNPTAAPASKPSGFNFGAAGATSSSTATSTSITPSLSFGGASNNAPLFGQASTTPSTPSTTRSSMFGAATASSTTTPSMMTQPSIFGSVATTTSAPGFTGNSIASGFGTSGPQPSAFPTTTSAASTFEAPKTMETSSFGNNTSAPPSFVQTPASSSLFGGINVAGANAKNSTKLPSFADNSFNKISSAGFNGNAERTGFAFGAAPTNASVLSPVNAFSSATTPNFGSTTSAPAPPAFGAASNSTTSFGSTTTAAPIFGSVAASAFGASSTSQNPSGTNFNAPSGVFGASTTTATTTTAPPAFPISATSSSSSSSSSSTSTGAFGNSSTTGGFGASSNFNSGTTGFAGFGAVANTTLTFGAQPSTENATFGSSTSASGNNNGANTGFTFGASKPNVQQQQQQQPEQNAVFTFGGGGASNLANNPSAGGSAPFQFNASAPQTGGFNFTGAPTTPAINFSKDGAASGSTFALPTAAGGNAFGVPPTSGGMFSIGTGSTTPRSRASRRKQR